MEEGDRWLLDMVKGIFTYNVRRAAARISGLFGVAAKPEPPSEAEKILTGLGLKYEKHANGNIFVIGDVDLRGKGYTELPDFSKLQLAGSFDCSNNPLTSLKGAPWQSTGIFSDLGNFTNWKSVPQNLRNPPPTVPAPAPAVPPLNTDDATTLNKPMAVGKALRLRNTKPPQ